MLLAGESLVESLKEILRISFFDGNGNSCQALIRVRALPVGPPERLLLCDGQPVPMTSKAFDFAGLC